MPWHAGRLQFTSYRWRWPALYMALLWTCAGIGDPRMGRFLWPLAGIAAAAVLVVPMSRRAYWMHRRRRYARTPVGIVRPWHLDDVPWREGREPVRLTASLPYARSLGAALLCAGVFWYALNITKAWRTDWGFGLALVSVIVGTFLTSRGTARTNLRRTGPVRVGDRAEFTFWFEKSRGSPAVFDRLTFTLRCLTERPRWGGLLPAEVRCLYCGRIEHGENLPPSPIAVDLEFAIPADAPGTDVLAEPAVFWDLLVEGDGAGFRYRQEFLVPVYATDRPGGALTP